MIEESATQGKEKILSKIYDEMILSKKDYSFIVIDKSAKRDKRYLLYDGTECTSKFIDIL